jgi:hypothetical protein
VPSQPFPAHSRSTRSSLNTPTVCLDPPDSRTSKSAAKRESCRNTSDYRTQPRRGQSKPSANPTSQNTERFLQSLLFFRPRLLMGENLAGKALSPIGDWIALYQATRWRRFVVCRPGLEKQPHPIDGVAHQPGEFISFSGRFQEASDWPSKQKGRFHEAALPVIQFARIHESPGSRRRESLPIALFARTLRIALWTGCGCRSLCGLPESFLIGYIWATQKTQDYSGPNLSDSVANR